MVDSYHDALKAYAKQDGRPACRSFQLLAAPAGQDPLRGILQTW